MISFTEPSENAARERARRMRKVAWWRNVNRTGRTVTAERLCGDCGAPIGNDAELFRHFGGEHDARA